MNVRDIDDFLEPERYELREAPAHRFDLARRDFLKAVGGGIAIAILLPRVAPADEAAGPRPQDGEQAIGAFLHVGADGAVTVYTGKVEVGQDIRTSLTQAVAEELCVSPRDVTMVMGDTDCVPYDRGTFGSRTTPMMAPLLQRAAATARELLIGLAATRLEVERGELTVADGAVRHEPSGRSVPFGDLTRGQALTGQVDDSIEPASATGWTVKGRSIPKVHATALVTGAHRYPSDTGCRGMLHGAVLRPPAFGAELRSLDESALADRSDVTVVRDGSFVGVVAPSSHEARAALALLRAEWSIPAAPADHELREVLRATGREAGRRQLTRGDSATALAAAPHRLDATWFVPYIAHAPLEPRAALARWREGKLTVWTGTQRPFGVREELVKAFRLSPSDVRVKMPDTGSGFGGKHTGDAAIEAAALARAVDRPVSVCWSREEEFTWAYFRPAGLIDIRAGVDADGRLVAWEQDNYNSGTAALEPPYDVPHQHCRFLTTDSPLRQGSYRGLASPANHFAREGHLDDLAAMVGMDPLAFRRRNLSEPRLRAVLDAAAERAGWGGPVGESRGRGIACGTDKGSYVATVADVRVKRGELTVERLVTAFECGAVVHPDNLESQIEGMAVQALGGALYEAIGFADGRIRNPRFSAYRVPRFADVPELVTVVLDRKDLPSAGAGETPMSAIAPAIRNAIAAATGQRLRELPLKLG